MARGRWGPAAAVMAMLANIHRDPKKRPRPFGADYFNPFAADGRAKATPATKADLAMLRGAFEAFGKRAGRTTPPAPAGAKPEGAKP